MAPCSVVMERQAPLSYTTAEIDSAPAANGVLKTPPAEISSPRLPPIKQNKLPTLTFFDQWLNKLSGACRSDLIDTYLKYSVPAKVTSGVHNDCGQHAIRHALAALDIIDELPTIVQRTNPRGIFTAPTTMAEYLSRHIPADHRSNGSLAEICREIKAGRPAILLVAHTSAPHWITIVGLQHDKAGQLTGFHYRDNKYHQDCGFLSVDELSRSWGRPFHGSQLLGYERVWIKLDPSGRCSPSLNFDTAPADLCGAGINNTLIACAKRDPFGLLSGILDTVFGAVTTVVSGFGRALIKSGEDSIERGIKNWRSGGLIHRAIGAVQVISGTAQQTIGRISKFVGNTAASVYSGAKKLISWAFG